MIQGEGTLDAIFKKVINTRGIYPVLGYKDRFGVLMLRQHYKKGQVALEKKIEVVQKAGYDVAISVNKK